MSTASTRIQFSVALAGLSLAGMAGAGLITPVLANAAPTASPSESAQPAPAATAVAVPTASSAPTPPKASDPADGGSPNSEQTPDQRPSATDSQSPSSPAEQPTPSTSDPQSSDSPAATPSPTPSVADSVGADAVAPKVEAQADGDGDISLSKTASPTRVSRVGQVVSYRFVATNTGSAELENVAITDEMQDLGSLSCNRPTPATVPAGETLTCTASLTVSQATLDFGDIYNFATVNGEVPGIEGAEPESVGANAAATVQVDQRPAVGLRASVSPSGKADLGDRLNYSATLTNTGNVTLSSAKVSSNIDADWTCPTTSAAFAPGAELQCSGSYRVARADARRGQVAAVITGAGWSPYAEQRVTDSERINVSVTKLPSDSTGESSNSTNGGLADTGAPTGGLAVAVAGLLAVAAGAVLLLRRNRSRR